MQHLEAAGRLELLGEDLAERQHDVLLDGAVLLGTGVVTAVARIDDDDRLERALRPAPAGDTAGRGSGGCSPARTQRKRRRRHGGRRGLWTAGLLVMLAVLSGPNGIDLDDELLAVAVGGLLDLALDTITGSVTSRMMRDCARAGIAGAERFDEADGAPLRLAAGSRSFVSATSITTRLGLVSEKTSNFAVFGNPMRKRVR